MTTKSIYTRALGISALKSVTYILLVLACMLTIADDIPPVLFLAALHVFYFFITFLYAEWIFHDPHVRTQRLIGVILLTFLLELAISTAFFRWLGLTTLDAEVLLKSGVFLLLHGSAMSAALYLRKRSLAKHGLAEGLES
jgi:hypothetical protein